MPSPFPGMDPYVEENPLFHEIHTQMLASAQGQLNPRLRPKYVARIERHAWVGGDWGLEVGEFDEGVPDVAVIESNLNGADRKYPSSAKLATAAPTAVLTETLDPDELELMRQRRIVVYVDRKPRQVVTVIELISPSNKQAGSTSQRLFLEKRDSAIHAGVNWVEIDLLRSGRRFDSPAESEPSHYAAYLAICHGERREHQVFAWSVRDRLPTMAIPLLNGDAAPWDVQACFDEAYERTAADTEVDYATNPPPPRFSDEDLAWIRERLERDSIR